MGYVFNVASQNTANVMAAKDKQELTVFHQHNERFINLLWTHPFSHQEICTIYLQCYLPSVAYLLPATTLPSQHVIHNAQKAAMSVFLTKFGYPRTYPRASTYALIDCRGFGFRHLSHEAGLQQSMQFIKHLHLNTSIGQLFQILIQHYQLFSGFKWSILEEHDQYHGAMHHGWIGYASSSGIYMAKLSLNHHGSARSIGKMIDT